MLGGPPPDQYAGIAALAEDAGFESVFVADHVVFPPQLPATYPHTADGVPPVLPTVPLFDPLVVLGAVATATTSIRLGTGVYLLPLRHPLHVARMLVTVDALSGGRVTLGVGVGWLEDEFAALGASFGSRGRRTDEMIAVLRRLFAEDVVAHSGDSFSWPPMRFEPKPARPEGIPIEIGGMSAAAMRRAGTVGDGWLESGSKDLTDLAGRIDIVLGHRAAAGRGGPFEITSRMPASFDPAAVQAHAEIGVTRIASRPPVAHGSRPGADDYQRFIERYARTVIEPYGAGHPS